jgi:Asp-tRNA(Asn)/Glu-tRNA(Gln) amidotransferase A subunit family amidase
MAKTVRFPDWSSLPERDRPNAARECRERMEQVGRRLHALAGTCAHAAPDEGTLAGMPYVAKDMIATGRTAPSWGCAQPLVSNTPAASVIACLDRAGASLIGTAEMTELAYEPSGVNAARGHVLNPWHFDYVPGGSSSGSAALVAAGCCFAALGSDTGGSVRIPAHCCGVTGLKPSWGKLPLDGTMPLAPSLDTIGLLARSAADVAMVWSALLDDPIPRITDAISGVVLADAFDESDPEIAQICRAAIDMLARSGMHIHERTGFPEAADKNCLLVMGAEAARTHGERLNDERLDATLRKRLAKGLIIGDDTLATALNARADLRDQFFADQFGDAAVMFLPVMPITTPRFAEVDPASSEFKARTLYALSRFTRFVNYFGLPALAIPAGFDSRGMPVGLQMIGRPGYDALLLAIGMRLQAETDWQGRVPAAIAAGVVAELNCRVRVPS